MAANTLDTAQGWTKEVYGKINDVRPAGTKFINRVGFSKGDKLGRNFNEPVILTHEQGFTYDSGENGDAFDLNDAVAAVIREASLHGSEIVLRHQMSYKLFTSTVDAGKQAFQKATALRLMNMKLSFEKRLEIATLYGGSLGGIGVPSARISGSGTATQVYSITAASYAPGIWAGSVRSKIDAYDVSGSPSKINTNADITVAAFTPAVGATLAQVTLTGNATDLDAVNSAIADAAFFFKGAQGEEALGLRSQVSNTGEMHGIQGATYEMWRGNVVPVGGADLTWDTVATGIGDAVGRGLDEDVVLQVSIPTWSNLNNNLAALRMLDSSYKETKTSYGSSALEFHFINGKITVEPSIYQKYGESMWYVPNQCKRIGSTDTTFQIEGERIWRHLEDKAGVEARAYSDQALLVRRPANMGVFTGIVNSFS